MSVPRESELFRNPEEGERVLPVLYNRPGLPELRYRVGTHPQFLARMISRLHTWALPDGPGAGTAPLASLNPRPRADLAVCFLDAWAVVGDVLTFYQERIANEGFLRTATEERSVWELVRSLGYAPDRGAAAGTYLAFWVTEGAVRSGLADAAPVPSTAREVGASTPPVRVPAGTVVQSVPRDGGQPQTFETRHDIEARAEWNTAAVYLPRRVVRPRIDPTATRVRLEGLRPGLRAGDPLLLVGDPPAGGGEAPWLFRTVRKVEPDRKRGYTVVGWDPVPPTPGVAPLANPRAFTYRGRHTLFGHDAPRWEAQTLETQRRYRDLRGGVFRSLDGGASWSAANGYSPDAPEQRDAPGRWIPASAPDADTVRALAVGPDGAFYAAVAGKGVFRSRDDGASWQPASTGLRKSDVRSLTVNPRG
ncbi:MAG TPA: hypothetical protein VHG28_25220, partial [Longimicrobiaceae bacterium]|nr:hypothetical protein [Longimicrobiaceae bacterium]